MVTFRKYDPEIHHRRSIRLQNWDYSNAGSYFVTFNLGDQTVQLGRIESGKMYYNDYGVIVVNTWLDLPNHYDNVRLDEFRVMLDHVHGIVFIKTSIATKDSINAINTDAKLVDVMHVGAIHESPRQTEQKKQREQQNESQHNQRNLMDYCNRRRKMLLSKIIGWFKMVSSKQINILRKTSGKLWQRDYYEHIIRDNESFKRIRKYIQENPGKWNNRSFELNR